MLSKAQARDESLRKNGKMGDMSDMSSSLMSLLEDLRGGASLLEATHGNSGQKINDAGGVKRGQVEIKCTLVNQ